MSLSTSANLSSEASDSSDASMSGGWTLKACYTLLLLHLVYAFNFFDRLLISYLFPLIQEDLQLSDTELGLVTGVVFVLIYSIMGIPIARLADVYSRKTIIGIGFTFWSAMTYLTGYVSNVWQLAATRFAMGAGEAAGVPPSTSMLSDLFNKKCRPLAFSIMVSGTAFAGLVLTPIAGWVGQHYGWRTAYFIAGAVGMFLGLLMLLTVKEPKRGQYDAKASEEMEKKPAFKISLAFLKSQKAFVFATLGAGFTTISYYAHIVWGTTFMVRIHGMDVASSAALLGPVRGIAGLAGALTAGIILNRLLKRNEKWSVWLPALSGALVGLAQYIFIFAPTPTLAAVGVAIDSFAASMMVPLMSLLLMQIMPPQLRAFGMAMYVLVIALLGQIIGPLGIGAMNDFFADIWQQEAIRYSMSVTALIGAFAGPVLLIAGSHLKKNVEAAEQWTGK